MFNVEGDVMLNVVGDVMFNVVGLDLNYTYHIYYISYMYTRV